MRTATSQALRTTFAMALFGLGVPLLTRAFGEETRIWPFVAMAPLIGWVTYLQAAGKLRTLAIAGLALGIGGVLFWTALFVSGRWPVAGPSDYVFIAFILSLPVLCIAIGLTQLRKLGRAADRTTS